MAIRLGSAYGKVELDSSGVQRGVATATSSLKNLSAVGLQVGNTLKSVGNMMTIGLTLPILAMGAASVKAASDLEETRNKVSVVFGEMSDDVLEWGDSAAQAFGQSKQQALEAAGTFGNLFTSMGLGQEKSAEMSKGLVELAADLASFNDMDPTVVLEKLRSGLVGEVEPLRTLGVNLTATAVKAKAMEMGLADANGEVSQAAMVQARYALILEQTTNAQGDFARTSDGLANQTRILNAQFKDALAILGENLLPIALAVVKALNKMLEAFNNMPPFVQKGILILLALIALMGPLIAFIGTVIGAISSIAGFVGTLGSLGISLSSIGTLLTGTLIPAIISMGTAIWGALLPILPIIIAIIAIVAGLAFVVWALATDFMGVATAAKQLGFIIQYYVKKAFDDLKKPASDFKDAWNESMDVWKNNFKQANEINQKVQEIAIEAMIKVVVDFVGRANNKLTELRNWAINTWNSITSGFTNAWSVISNYFESVKNSIINGIQAIKDAVNDLIASLAEIVLPDALTPGSPTPFETGLRGIAAAMRDLSQMAIPDLNQNFASMQLAAVPAQAVSGGGRGGSFQQINNFASGLTERHAARMIENSQEDLMDRLARSLEEWNG